MSQPQGEVVLELLSRAYGLIEQGWCQHVYAVSSQGIKCDEIDPMAVRWCLLGALRRASTASPVPLEDYAWAIRKVEAALSRRRDVHEGMILARGRLNKVPQTDEFLSLVKWQDARRRSQEDVLGLLAEAMAAA